MRLLADTLNYAKGAADEVPYATIMRLVDRLDNTCNDVHSDVPGATHRE